MLKKLLITSTLIISLAITGCSSLNVTVDMDDDDDLTATAEQTNDNNDAEEPMVGMANPWHEIPEEEARQTYPRMFKVPDDATNAVWRILDSAADEKTGKGPLIELDFDIVDEFGSPSYNARYQYGTGESEDITGMYYDWTVTDENTLSGWGGGNMNAKFYRYLGEDETVDLCTWYDIEIGISYCLSTSAPDLDGFDIQGIVEAMYPGDDAYFEGTDGAPDIDISGCDTFTQIVDKLEAGRAYTNTTLDGTDVLLIASGAYDDTEGHYNCIDANVYCYVDGAPKYLGSVASNSTAYPITVNNGKLYVGGHHFISKYTVTDNKLVVVETAGETFDEAGNATFYYDSDDGGDYSDIDQAAAEGLFDQLNNEMFEGTILEFDVIK